MEEARFHTSTLPLIEGSGVNGETLRIFYRSALAGALYWIAARLMFARQHRLDEYSTEVFVGIAIHQLRRSELGTYLGLSEPAVQKRLRKLRDALGVGRQFSDITCLLNILDLNMSTPPSPDLLNRLEKNASALHAAQRPAQIG